MPRLAAPALGATIIRFQAVLVVAALAVAYGMASPGRAGVLIPLAGAGGAAQWATTRGDRLLGTGSLNGTVVVRVADRAMQWEALRSGLLLLPAPDTGCISRTSTKD